MPSVAPKLLVTSFAVLAVAACSVRVEPADDVGQSAEALSACSPSDAWWKTQYDDPSPGYCEGKTDYSNCGPASMAMMRYALTCGASNKTAAEMRSYINDTYTYAADKCGGTTAAEWHKTLANANADGTWFADGAYSTMTTVNHCVSSGTNADYTAADLAADMASGAVTVAIVAGNNAGGQKAPCGFDETIGHALFVSQWDGSKFTVYDPDSHKNSSGQFLRCGNSKPGNYRAQWGESQIAAWANGFGSAKAGKLCVLTATRTCIPGQTSSSGCAAGLEKTCAADFTWGECRCPDALTRVECLSRTMATP